MGRGYAYQLEEVNMGWNYRVMKREYPDKRYSYAIYEVYYNEAGKAEMQSVDPMYIYGETLEELKADLQLYMKALDKPVLSYETRKEVE